MNTGKRKMNCFFLYSQKKVFYLAYFLGKIFLKIKIVESKKREKL